MNNKKYYDIIIDINNILGKLTINYEYKLREISLNNNQQLYIIKEIRINGILQYGLNKYYQNINNINIYYTYNNGPLLIHFELIKNLISDITIYRKDFYNNNKWLPITNGNNIQLFNHRMKLLAQTIDKIINSNINDDEFDIYTESISNLINIDHNDHILIKNIHIITISFDHNTGQILDHNIKKI